MPNALLSISSDLIISFSFTFIFVRFFLKKPISLKFIDSPNHRKLHTNNIPAFGGISILFSLIITLLIKCLICDNYDFYYTREILGIIIGTFIIVGIGIIDDIYSNLD